MVNSNRLLSLRRRGARLPAPAFWPHGRATRSHAPGGRGSSRAGRGLPRGLGRGRVTVCALCGGHQPTGAGRGVRGRMVEGSLRTCAQAPGGALGAGIRKGPLGECGAVGRGTCAGAKSGWVSGPLGPLPPWTRKGLPARRGH